MRTIKFRCWFAGKMFYGIPAMSFSKEGVKRVDLNSDESDFSNYPDTWTGNDDYVLMQLTGITDAKGKEVWEGDVLQNDIGLRIIGVNWDYENLFSIEQQIKDFDGEGKWYVIGNIYENPELLK